jgi:hypothetical protein
MGNENRKDMVLVHGVFQILVRRNNQDNRAEQSKSSVQLKLVSPLQRCNKSLQGKESVEVLLQY